MALPPNAVLSTCGPTAERAQEHPTIVDALYDELGSAITIPSRWQLFICGDFNSKLGKLSQENREAGLTTCIGSYGSSKRNTNGEALAAFMCAQGLFATSMAFKHPCQHRTTWTGHIANRKAAAGSKATRALSTK